MQVEVQKRARSACTTFKALKSEWDEVRGEAQDAMTVFANANLELRTVDDLSFPETLSEVDVREALRASDRRCKDGNFPSGGPPAASAAAAASADDCVAVLGGVGVGAAAGACRGLWGGT